MDKIYHFLNVKDKDEIIEKINNTKYQIIKLIRQIPPYQYAIGGVYFLGHIFFRRFLFIRYPLSKLCVGYWSCQLCIHGISKVDMTLANKLTYYLNKPFNLLKQYLIPQDISNIFTVFKSVFYPFLQKLSTLSMSQVLKGLCYITADQKPVKYSVKHKIDKSDISFLSCVQHYAKYMTASYGHVMIHGVMGKGDMSDIGESIMNPGDKQLFIDSMCEYCNVKDEDIIYKQFTSKDLVFKVSTTETIDNPEYLAKNKKSDIESQIPKTITITKEKNIHIQTPPYFVIIDHEYHNIVLLIRGTFAAKDFVADFAGNCFVWKEGFVHQGMGMIANFLIHDTQLNVILKQALNNYPSYHLVSVGHSLGAAAAALTCIAWKNEGMYEKYMPIAYCYACPPCITKEVKNRGHKYVHCFINEEDMIPRLNKSSIENLINKIYSTSSSIDVEKSSFKNKMTLFFESLSLRQRKTVSSADLPGDFIIPGELYLLHPCYDQYELWENSRNNTLKKYINKDDSNNNYEVQERPTVLSPAMLHLAHGEKFPNTLIISSNMLTHHFTFNYEKIIENVYLSIKTQK